MDDVRLPLPEDATSVQLSIARISEALLSSRIDTKHAAQLLWGLQLALQSLNRPAPVWEDIEPVRSITRTKDGDDLAPIQEICEPDDDCNECEWADTCDDYHGDPRDNEDDEVGDGEESPEDEDCDEEEIGKEASDADSGSADDGQRKECSDSSPPVSGPASGIDLLRQAVVVRLDQLHGVADDGELMDSSPPAL